MLYRNRNFKPSYDPKDGMVTYFQGAQPGEWLHDAKSRTSFDALYGGQALLIADATGKVPENINASWVQQPYDSIPDAGSTVIDPDKLTPPVPAPTEFQKYVVASLESIKAKLGI